MNTNAFTARRLESIIQCVFQILDLHSFSFALKCPSEKGNELKGGYWMYDVVTK